MLMTQPAAIRNDIKMILTYTRKLASTESN